MCGVGASCIWVQGRAADARRLPASAAPERRQRVPPLPAILPGGCLVGAAAAGLAAGGVPVVASARVAGHVEVCAADARARDRYTSAGRLSTHRALLPHAPPRTPTDCARPQLTHVHLRLSVVVELGQGRLLGHVLEELEHAAPAHALRASDAYTRHPPRPQRPSRTRPPPRGAKPPLPRVISGESACSLTEHTHRSCSVDVRTGSKHVGQGRAGAQEVHGQESHA